METSIPAVSSVKICQHCGTDLVFLEQATVLEIKKMLRPNFRTLGVLKIVQGKKCHPICPKCDSYALGLDLVEPFPVLTQAGDAHG